jgi:hypothetical protein
MSRNFYKITCKSNKKKLGNLMAILLNHESAIHSMKRISTFSCEIIVKINKRNVDAFAEEAEVTLKKPSWDDIL